MAHRTCEECGSSVSGLIVLVGIGVAIFGSGGHAIAGAILAVGMEIASAFGNWTAHH